MSDMSRADWRDVVWRTKSYDNLAKNDVCRPILSALHAALAYTRES